MDSVLSCLAVKHQIPKILATSDNSSNFISILLQKEMKFYQNVLEKTVYKVLFSFLIPNFEKLTT